LTRRWNGVEGRAPSEARLGFLDGARPLGPWPAGFTAKIV
jgi:hypothetical protein